MKTIIYCIFDQNDTPIYIGKTNQKLNIRKNYRKYRFGYDITILELDMVDDWKFWEKYWICQFKSWGYSLKNKNDGGGGPTKHTDETRKRMSEKQKGRTFSDEHKNRLSSAAKLKLFSNTHRDNIGKKSLGRTKSDETKKQISKKLMGIKRGPLSDEHKERIRQAILLKSKIKDEIRKERKD